MKIGIFDSGLGGLTILRAIAKELPEYDYVYYGDTKHLPYGDKTESEILALTEAALTELFERDCYLVIVACNTASSETLRTLQDSFISDQFPDRKVLGVIVPTMEEVARLAPTKAHLLATKRTVESGKYQLELEKLTKDTPLAAHVATELVPLIESGKGDLAATMAIDILETSKVREGEVVILGCTHYALLKDSLRTALPKVQILAQDEIIPAKLRKYLERHPEIETNLSRNSDRTIHMTEHREDYLALAADLLGGTYVPSEGEG